MWRSCAWDKATVARIAARLLTRLNVARIMTLLLSRLHEVLQFSRVDVLLEPGHLAVFDVPDVAGLHVAFLPVSLYVPL